MEHDGKSSRDGIAAEGDALPLRQGKARSAFSKFSYLRWLPAYSWQRLTRHTHHGHVHLIFALADHFEPAIVPEDGRARAPYDEQERRLEAWCRDYPKAVGEFRDESGRPFVHTYFYPAEQDDRALVGRLADHCHSGWGELEIHLHHGVDAPSNSDDTRSLLCKFRDTLANEHGCLSYLDREPMPRYAFVHGNFALANSANGYGCGVDDEMKILAETGCYADLTLPAAAFHRAQIAKVNSLYECALPLDHRAPHRKGRDLKRGERFGGFPVIIQGPLMLDFDRSSRSGLGRFETAALTDANPPSMRRLRLWKKAAISVLDRPDWIFVKLHCHSMFPNYRQAVLGDAMQGFLSELTEGARDRQETLHFVTAREMVNILWAACEGREGNPDEYRNYRLRLASREGHGSEGRDETNDSQGAVSSVDVRG